jgi:hypothetical protein
MSEKISSTRAVGAVEDRSAEMLVLREQIVEHPEK